MPNLTFDVKKEDDGEVIRIESRLKAIGGELSGLSKEMLQRALDDGYRAAVRLAPRGKNAKNEGHRIYQAIQKRPIVYKPGGAGGGGTYTGGIFVDEMIAPHFRHVFEGTGLKEGGGEGGALEIRARGLVGNLAGVFELQKGGENIKYRRAISGQRPQSEWWDEAEAIALAALEEEVSSAKIIHGI